MQILNEESNVEYTDHDDVACFRNFLTINDNPCRLKLIHMNTSVYGQ